MDAVAGAIITLSWNKLHSYFRIKLAKGQIYFCLFRFFSFLFVPFPLVHAVATHDGCSAKFEWLTEFWDRALRSAFFFFLVGKRVQPGTGNLSGCVFGHSGAAVVFIFNSASIPSGEKPEAVPGEVSTSAAPTCSSRPSLNGLVNKHHPRLTLQIKGSVQRQVKCVLWSLH